MTDLIQLSLSTFYCNSVNSYLANIFNLNHSDTVELKVSARGTYMRVLYQYSDVAYQVILIYVLILVYPLNRHLIREINFNCYYAVVTSKCI